MALMTAKEATLIAIAFVQPSNAFGTRPCVCLLAVNGYVVDHWLVGRAHHGRSPRTWALWGSTET